MNESAAAQPQCAAADRAREIGRLHIVIYMPTTFDIGRTGFSVRRAEAADAKAVRMLLPEMPKNVPSWVALDGAQGLVIGAAAVTLVPRTKPLLGPGVAVHVIEPCRGRGVGGALLEELSLAARRHHAQALYSFRRVELDSPAMHGWQRLGFSMCETVQEHELPLAEFEPRLAPIVARLQQQGRIPTSARIVPLYAADAEAVAQLHLDHMGGDRDALLARIRGRAPGAFHPRYSRVLVVDGRTVGCILAHRASRDVAVVDANIVDPAYRHGWANLWLKLEASRRAHSLGITHFRFTSFEHYADTRKFTAKLGGVILRTMALMMRSM